MDSWVCPGCVKCDTCDGKQEQASASDSASASVCSPGTGNAKIKRWGTRIRTCIGCHDKQEQDAQDQSLVVASGCQDRAHYRQLVDSIKNCKICQKDCSNSFLKCTKCENVTHPECNGELMLIFGGGAACYDVGSLLVLLILSYPASLSLSLTLALPHSNHLSFTSLFSNLSPSLHPTLPHISTPTPTPTSI